MKIALIELGGSHDECLYSHIKILKSARPVHLTLITNRSLQENIKYYDNVDSTIFFDMGRGIMLWMDILNVWLFCRRQKFDKIILNTAQGSVSSKLLLFPFSTTTRFYGILHDTRKLSTSVSQKHITKKLDSYFILSEYLRHNVPSGINHTVFYPVFFPEYPKHDILKPKEEVWICIPGQVELKRRDYETLFQSIRTYGLKKNMRLVFLGRYGHKHGDKDYLLERLSKLNLIEYVFIYEDFIPVPLFHTMLRQSDYILPLIHTEDISGKLYTHQISGAFNLAVAYQKPLLLEDKISEAFEMNEAITYPKHALMQIINDLPPHDSKDFYQDKKWAFDFQRENYLNELGINPE